jgi:hypothetical protein
MLNPPTVGLEEIEKGLSILLGLFWSEPLIGYAAISGSGGAGKKTLSPT